MSCIGLFADTAYSCDPRIKKFKEEEKARKESEKKAKAEAKKREQEEKERVSLIHIHSRSEHQIYHTSFNLTVLETSVKTDLQPYMETV